MSIFLEIVDFSDSLDFRTDLGLCFVAIIEFLSGIIVSLDSSIFLGSCETRTLFLFSERSRSLIILTIGFLIFDKEIVRSLNNGVSKMFSRLLLICSRAFFVLALTGRESSGLFG